MADLTEPADEARQRCARDAVGQQEVQILLLKKSTKYLHFHEAVKQPC
jgi:hypothetical protein